ncbi:MAG: hypothetical protein ACSHYF_05310 [Verrucomicrobiaceae bacterium]
MKNPPNPAATNLFKTYVSQAPEGTFPRETSTYQGLYCMMPDGSYLSGKFARQSNAVARDTLNNGLEKWSQITRKNRLKPKSVPSNPLAIYGGKELTKGGLKLEVAYRDLPRAHIERPGDAQFPNPYNLGWYDFTPAEAKSFLTTGKEKAAIPDAIFTKLARTHLKDAVRGQMNDWEIGSTKNGKLFTRLIENKDGLQTFELSGSAEMAANGRTFSPTLHGTATYNTRLGEFTDFRLLALGQRSGKGPANGRSTDPGPAPMAVAFSLYQP